MKHKKLYSWIRILPVAALVAFFSVSSLIPALRPTYSETEKRELTRRPQPDLTSVMNGSYFTAYDLWFSDTFPYRETLIDGTLKIRRLYGFQNTYIHGDIEPGDEIPDVPTKTPSRNTVSPSVFPNTTAPENTPPFTVPHETETVTPSPTVPPKTEKPSVTPTPAETENTVPQTLGAVLLIGDSAYEYYSFNRTNSDQYAAMVSGYEEALRGYASVYSMIIPNSMGIVPDDDIIKNINTSDQGKAIQYIFSQMHEDVKKVSIYDTLKAHKSEYLYFRTDHHWTALGAYYAYREFAALKGIVPNALTDFETMEFPGFLGTFYTKTGKPKAMEDHPDIVIAYIPKGTNAMQFTGKDGSVTNWKVITNVTTWKQNAKYNTFIGGDNPYSVISNPNVKNGQSCLVIKESYGNAFVPFLVDHYETVYVIDYRYYQGSVTEFVKTNHVTDVIFANNITATRSEAAIRYMLQIQ